MKDSKMGAGMSDGYMYIKELEGAPKDSLLQPPITKRFLLSEMALAFYENAHQAFLTKLQLDYFEATENYLNNKWDSEYYLDHVSDLQNILKEFSKIERRVFDATTPYAKDLNEAFHKYIDSDYTQTAAQTAQKISYILEAQSRDEKNSYLEFTNLARKEKNEAFQLVENLLSTQELIQEKLPDSTEHRNRTEKINKVKKSLIELKSIYGSVDFKTSSVDMVMRQASNGNIKFLKIPLSLQKQYQQYDNLMPSWYVHSRNFNYQFIKTKSSLAVEIKNFLKTVFVNNVSWLQKERKKLLKASHLPQQPHKSSESSHDGLQLPPPTRYEKYYKEVDQRVQATETEHKTQLIGVLQKIKAITNQEEFFSQIDPEHKFQLEKSYPEILNTLVKQCLIDNENYLLTGIKDPHIAQALDMFENNLRDILEVKLLKNHKDTAVITQYLKAKR